MPEIHSKAAARLLDSEVILLAPDLIWPEFGNILWKKVRRAELTHNEAVEVLNAFAGIPLDIHPSAVLLPAAFALAVRLDRSRCDSLYLALATGQDWALVTADAKFHYVVVDSPLAGHICWVDSD